MSETKIRSIIKTFVWRIFAIINSFLILVFSTTDNKLLNAIYMNITGFFMYYFFERISNRIKLGKM